MAAHADYRPTDDTTRRLHFGAPPTAPTARALPQLDEATTATPRAHTLPGAIPMTAGPRPADSAAEQAEEALRALETEWAVRMEAPLAALANLEATLDRAIDDATRRLPFPPGTGPAR